MYLSRLLTPMGPRRDPHRPGPAHGATSSTPTSSPLGQAPEGRRALSPAPRPKTETDAAPGERAYADITPLTGDGISAIRIEPNGGRAPKTSLASGSLISNAAVTLRLFRTAPGDEATRRARRGRPGSGASGVAE